MGHPSGESGASIQRQPDRRAASNAAEQWSRWEGSAKATTERSPAYRAAHAIGRPVGLDRAGPAHTSPGAGAEAGAGARTGTDKATICRACDFVAQLTGTQGYGGYADSA